jgi:hypothetical protein
MRATFIALAALLLFGSSAIAADDDGPPAACTADVQKVCPGASGDARWSCIEGKSDQLSEACQNALDAGADPAATEEDAPADSQN